MPEGTREPMPITSSLESVVRSLRGPDRSTVSGVFGRWDEVVGEAVAAHVRPLKLDRGLLVVEVDDPAWATQVRFLSGTIIERLVEVAGVQVERVETRVEGDGGRRPRRQTS